MKTLSTALLLLLPLILPGGAPVSITQSQPPTPVLTFADRIQAQEAIERVFYNHRIWPKENPQPKPAFETMVAKELIGGKAKETLLKSAALRQYWNTEITHAMMQSEMDRMGRETLEPATLNELFTALGNDPILIGEVLARDNLADRLIRNRFAYDERIQGGAFQKAKTLRERAALAKDWKMLGGQYSRTIIRKGQAGQPHEMMPEMPGEFTVEPERFAALLKKYSPTNHSSDPAQFPVTGVGAELSSAQNSAQRRELSGSPGMEIFRAQLSSAPTPDSIHYTETADGFLLSHLVSMTDNRIETEVIVVPKVKFDEWWGAHKSEFAGAANALTASRQSASALHLPAIATVAGCDTWDDPMKINKMPEVRENHSAVWTGTEMIVWGGYNRNDPSGFRFLNSGGRYNPATDSWSSTSVGANVPAGREGQIAVWTGSEMIIWGGGSYFPIDSSGGRYNPASDRWLPTSTASAPEGRVRHVAVWTGSEMIVWGGYGNGFILLNSGGRYNPQTEVWTPTSTGANLPTPRWAFLGRWTGSELIVWGGCTSSPTAGSCSAFLNTGGRYNPLTDSWTPTSIGANVPAARAYHAGAWTGSELIVWGGRDGSGRLNSGGRYNPSSDSWTPTSTGANVPTTRSLGDRAVWTGTEMIVWSDNLTITGGRYNPTGDSWQPTSTGLGVPQLRSGYSVVWTGSEMIVWGGADYTRSPVEYLNSGGRYNPSTDSWLATGDVNVPSSREEHTSVWTGAEMIVWGGYHFDGLQINFNTGGRYKPALSVWQPTSLGVNVPSSREYHTAVWTGNMMIVWGGYGSSYLGDGALYDPSTDTWSVISLIQSPSARALHTAVWTGSEMIVWGGRGSSYFITGGRFNPNTNSWAETSIELNVPESRIIHTMVWTGNEAIVWGGCGATSPTCSTMLNNGGRYNPSTDSWQPVSLSLAPLSRAGHATVWSDGSMIIWGGALCNTSSTCVTNTGGRYKPSTNTWIDLSIGTNTPDPRSDSSFIWTGGEMIIWGGYGALNSGGRYSPTADLWQSTSIGRFTPPGRLGHTGIWTGNNMIVWGGDLGNHSMNDGGIYISGSVPSPENSLRGTKSSFINLRWSMVYGAGSYNVKRCNPGATGCIPGTVVSTPTINQYSEVDDGLSHFYAVEAVNQCGATP